MHRINLSQLDNTVGLPNSYSQDTDFISGRYYAIQLWSTFEQQEPSSALFSICIWIHFWIVGSRFCIEFLLDSRGLFRKILKIANITGNTKIFVVIVIVRRARTTEQKPDCVTQYLLRETRFSTSLYRRKSWRVFSSKWRTKSSISDKICCVPRFTNGKV